MRTELTSPANPKIKYVVKLRSCATREETGEMIVEGCRECRRALDKAIAANLKKLELVK